MTADREKEFIHMNNHFGALLFQSERPTSSKRKIKTISFIPLVFFLLVMGVLLLMGMPSPVEIREDIMERVREEAVSGDFIQQIRGISPEGDREELIFSDESSIISYERNIRAVSVSEVLLYVFLGLTVLHLLRMIYFIEIIKPSQIFVYEKGVVLEQVSSSKNKKREIPFAKMKGVLFYKQKGEGVIYQKRKRRITLSPVNSPKVEETIEQIQQAFKSYLISLAKESLEDVKVHFGSTARLERGVLRGFGNGKRIPLRKLERFILKKDLIEIRGKNKKNKTTSFYMNSLLTMNVGVLKHIICEYCNGKVTDKSNLIRKYKNITDKSDDAYSLRVTEDEVILSVEPEMISYPFKDLDGIGVLYQKGSQMILYTKNQEKIILNPKNTVNFHRILEEVLEAHTNYMLDEISAGSIDDVNVRFGNKVMFSKGEFYLELDEIPLEKIRDVYSSLKFLYFKRERDEKVVDQLVIDYSRVMNYRLLEYLVFELGEKSIRRSYPAGFHTLSYLHTKAMKNFEEIYKGSEEEQRWLAFSAPLMLTIFESPYTFKMKREIAKPSLKRRLEEKWEITDGETALEAMVKLASGSVQTSMVDTLYHGLKACQIKKHLELEEEVILMDVDRFGTDEEDDIEQNEFPMEEYLALESALGEKYNEIHDEFKEYLTNIDYKGIGSDLTEMNHGQEAARILSNFSWASNALLSAKYSAKDLCELKSLAAWDVGRVGYIARICVHLGYLEESDVWEYIKDSGERGLGNYGSWREYLAAYSLGQALAGEYDVMWNWNHLIIKYLAEDDNSPYLRLEYRFPSG